MMAELSAIPRHKSIHEKRKIHYNFNMINRIKYLILLAYIFGLNRLFLLKWRKVFILLSYIHTCVLLLLAIFVFLINIWEINFIKLPNVILTFEHVILIIALLLSNNELDKFYRDLNKFDETLNINNDTPVTVPIKTTYCAIVILFLFELIKGSVTIIVVFCYGVRYESSFEFTLGVSILFYMSRNIEQLIYKFHFSLLLIRLKILKAHVLKLYNFDNSWCEEKDVDNVEVLYKNARLDVGALHKMYETLHKCWLRWNLVCGTPLTVILCFNALSTTLAVALIVIKIFAVGLPGNEHRMLPSGFQLRALYQVMVSFKCFLMTLIPCYYASATRTQASVIHATLSDALNQKNLDAVERLKVEAFLELTKDSTFNFSLFSIVKVDMFLPLRYLNFCLTYVIITISFAKFMK